MSNTLFCFIPGGKRVFSVEIDKTKIVDQLKKEIKKEKKPELNAFTADALTLYLVTIRPSLNNNQRETALTHLSQDLEECDELDDTH